MDTIAATTWAGRCTTMALVVLALGGCQAGDRGGPTEQTTLSDGEYATPLDDYADRYEAARTAWSAGWDDDAHAQREEIVAACMVAQGFEYFPSGPTAVDTIAAAPDWGSSEYVAQYGYGVATSPHQALEQAYAAANTDDPNLAYLEGLSAEALEAYEAALYGRADENGATSADPTGRGCRGQAELALPAPTNTSPPALDDVTAARLTALEEEIGQVRLAVLADARLAETTMAWADCMADAGHPGLSVVADAEEQVRQGYAALEAEVLGDGGSLPQAEWDAAFAQLQARLRSELQPFEITMATDDYACRDSSGYTEVLAMVTEELQQDFVDSHLADLEAWVASVEMP